MIQNNIYVDISRLVLHQLQKLKIFSLNGSLKELLLLLYSIIVRLKCMSIVQSLNYL